MDAQFVSSVSDYYTSRCGAAGDTDYHESTALSVVAVCSAGVGGEGYASGAVEGADISAACAEGEYHVAAGDDALYRGASDTSAAGESAAYCYSGRFAAEEAYEDEAVYVAGAGGAACGAASYSLLLGRGE